MWKVFIRSPKTIFKLEEIRLTRLISLITLIQAQWRMFATRRHYRKMISAQTKISAVWRGYFAKREYLKKKACTLVIQSFYRGMLARRELAQLKLEKLREKSATTIAAYWRGYLARKELRKHFRAHASPIIGKVLQNLPF